MRTRPRNPYRSRVLVNAVNRAWRQRAGLPDLDQLFRNHMQETTVQNDIELELSLRGRDRTLLLPRVSLTNLEPALERLGWFKQTAAVDQRIAERAEAALNALAKAAGWPR